MTILKYIRKIKSFSVIFIPEDASHKARSLKLSFNNLFLLGLIYTLICAFVGFYVFSFTGLDNVLLTETTGLKEADRQKVEELNTKIIFLVKEMEKLKATNERLKYALILGDSTMFDSVDQIQDSVEQDTAPPVEGNILKVVYRLLSGKNIQKKTVQFIKPVNGYLSKKFNSEKGHMGLDFAVKEGTPVFASAGGYVVFSDYTVNEGYMVILNHCDGYVSVYKHCSALVKNLRENVEQGELIAISGNTGKYTTGPHLHFEIWKNGRPVDPGKIIINY